MENSIDFEKMQNFIDDMYSGNIEKIQEGLEHEGALFRINAILSIAENKIKDKGIIEKVKELENDDTLVDAIRVGDYASGLLDVYKIKKYTGNSRLIKELIKDNMIM